MDSLTSASDSCLPPARSMPSLDGVKPPLFTTNVTPDITSGLSSVAFESISETRPYSSLSYTNSSTPNSMDLPPAQRNHDVAATVHQSYQSATPVRSIIPHPQLRRASDHSPAPRTSVRRSKSEGHVQVTGAGGNSVVPHVCTDATISDRLWSKLDPPNIRDSMSSSSSLSSSDTVIDLSMPNLARQTAPWPGCPHAPLRSCSSAYVNMSNPNLQQTLAPLRSCSFTHVIKSKSNPNIQQTIILQLPVQDTPGSQSQQSRCEQSRSEQSQSEHRQSERRHTWNRLFMEALRQSGGAPATASMSKSLGDLTSDDISTSFDSKYRSISRSFIIRPSREALRSGRPPTDTLTAQLRRLTNVEPLTHGDLAHSGILESKEASVDEGLVRRTSSRSQSRVRYIANRAKKAQERQRLQGLCRGSGSSPLEERGNPEGACCITQSPCSSLDLLSQLVPLDPASPRNQQGSLDPGSDSFYTLKL